MLYVNIWCYRSVLLLQWLFYWVQGLCAMWYLGSMVFRQQYVTPAHSFFGSVAVCLVLLRPCPHVSKRSFFPSSLALFQQYLRPNGSIINDSTHVSSYSRPIGDTSPQTKKRQSMPTKLAHCIQTDSRRRIWTHDLAYAVVHNPVLLSIVAKEQNILP